MAIMDITDIEPLLMAHCRLLQESDFYLWQHPCFNAMTEKIYCYIYDIAIEEGNQRNRFSHRSIQDIAFIVMPLNDFVKQLKIVCGVK